MKAANEAFGFCIAALRKLFQEPVPVNAVGDFGGEAFLRLAQFGQHLVIFLVGRHIVHSAFIVNALEILPNVVKRRVRVRIWPGLVIPVNRQRRVQNGPRLGGEYGDNASSVVRCATDFCGDDASSVV